MHVLSTLALAMFAGVAQSWTLQDDYGTGSSFFDKFTFFTDEDPTHGYVSYVDEATASSAGLISTNGSSAYIGVDSTNTASGSGRQSVRISSINTYSNPSLVILDLEHMPSSACGSWPAFWMLGPDWPATGEIDIIEYVNKASYTQTTLHTNPNCIISNSGTGTTASTDCDAAANGCGVQDSDPNSFGDGFNQNGGGVYVTQWTSDSISVWFFPRSSIPDDITNGQPDPTTWNATRPVTSFSGCDFSANNFKTMSIVFDVTFCGDWAGDTFSTCGAGSSCQDYVANNPGAFSDVYWTVNSLKVYNGGLVDDLASGLGINKRDTSEVPHAHAAEHAHGRRANPHARPGSRSNRMHRREAMKIDQ